MNNSIERWFNRLLITKTNFWGVCFRSLLIAHLIIQSNCLNSLFPVSLTFLFLWHGHSFSYVNIFVHTCEVSPSWSSFSFSLSSFLTRSFAWSLFNRNNIRIEWAAVPRLSSMSHSSRRVNIPLNTSNLFSERQGHSFAVCICVKREQRKRARGERERERE